MELPAGDGAPLLETDHPEPDKGGWLTPVGTLEHHGDLKSNQVKRLNLALVIFKSQRVVQLDFAPEIEVPINMLFCQIS